MRMKQGADARDAKTPLKTRQRCHLRLEVLLEIVEVLEIVKVVEVVETVDGVVETG